MPIPDGDWRLQGQERHLQRATLQWARWAPPRPGSDHDHCEFCWAKFMEEDGPDVLHEGYATADRYRWICATCFHDFKDRFEWQLSEPVR
jgi:hypothetical protein